MNELTVRREMNPANWQMIEAIAESTAMAKSEQTKIAKHLLFCFENDLPLSLAVNGGLYTVKNRVEVEGTVIRAQIRKHPDYDYEIKKLNDKECIIVVFRILPLVDRDNEQIEIGQASFTIEDAERVIVDSKTGKTLADKDNWKHYPADMLLNRATSRAYKRFCPDIFMQSVYVNGEISQQPEITTIDADGVIIPTIQEMMEENPQGVLDALNNTDGSQQAVYEYLQEVE